MSPQVSVIIPTYKHRDYILQTLDSVFAQTYTDYEVIVINDGSPDDTSQVLEELVSQGKINYIEQPNAGQAAARNRGLAQATGEFIAFLDDDDLWPPDKLEWQVEFLQAHPSVAVIGGSVQPIDGEGNHQGAEQFHGKPVTFESLFSGCPFISPGQTLMRALAVRAIGGFNPDLWGVDDYNLWFQLLKSQTIRVLPRLSLYYRYHASNASNDIPRMFENILKVVGAELPQAAAARRLQLARETYRWLYPSVGQPAIVRLRVDKLRPLSGALRALVTLSRFAWPALRDRRLRQRMWRDAIPNALQFTRRLSK